MQMDRERATASPTAAVVTPSSSQETAASPDPPPRSSRRRLLPQPDRAAALELAARAAKNKDAGLCRSASAVSCRYFLPISNHEDHQQRESNTPSYRRLSLGVDTSVGGTLVSLAAAGVVASTTAELHDRRVLDEETAVRDVQENTMNNPACMSRTSIESHCDNAEMLPSATTATPPRRQHHDQFVTSAVNEPFHNEDKGKLCELPEDEHGQPSTRFLFRSLTLPRRWKSHHPNGESSKSVDRQDCRMLWTTHAGACNDVHHVTEPHSSMSDCNNNRTSTQPQVTSASALVRVEAMKDRFKRLSEMYKNSLEEDSATTFTKTKKIHINDVGKDIKNQLTVGDADITGTEVAEVGSKATSDDTESLSSCGRDEGFESETATNSVVYGSNVSCPESRHSHHPAADVTAAAATEPVATICSEGNLFASSIDSIIQQTNPGSFDGNTTFNEDTADASPSSSVGATSTDEVARGSEIQARDDTATPTSASNRLSRISQQRAFAERMSAPRRSVTRSPQRRTSASSSDATSRSGLYSSPMARRKTMRPSTNGPSPPPSDYKSSAAGVENRRRSDAGEVDGITTASSRFVRGSLARTSLPHTDISVRAAGSARPAYSREQKQSLPMTSSSRHTHRSASKIQEGQTIKVATGLSHTPVVTHVDRNGVQKKPSSAARVFSTPVRFGPTSHQTRPEQNAAAERQNAGGVDNSTSPSKQTDNGHSHRGKNQQSTENGSEVASDNSSTPRISERKSVFERLFEKSKHQRYSKPGTNGISVAPVAQAGCKHDQVAESHKKISFRRPSTSSTNPSARQSVNSDSRIE